MSSFVWNNFWLVKIIFTDGFRRFSTGTGTAGWRNGVRWKHGQKYTSAHFAAMSTSGFVFMGTQLTHVICWHHISIDFPRHYMCAPTMSVKRPRDCTVRSSQIALIKQCVHVLTYGKFIWNGYWLLLNLKVAVSLSSSIRILFCSSCLLLPLIRDYVNV